MKTEVAKMAIALPVDVKGWVEREAARDDRSQNSVVVRALRARMQQEQLVEKRGSSRCLSNSG